MNPLGKPIRRRGICNVAAAADLQKLQRSPLLRRPILVSIAGGRRYILGRLMRTRLLLVTALVALMSATALADRRSDAKAQVDFGIRVAQKNLWKEAVFRFEKAIEIDKTYGGAWNNLGIAYEQLGRFDDARKAYEKALELEPNNNFIRNNYDLFREIYDRQNRRRDR
jgi:tetratricopeptide (TPR) repeat protein